MPMPMPTNTSANTGANTGANRGVNESNTSQRRCYFVYRAEDSKHAYRNNAQIPGLPSSYY